MIRFKKTPYNFLKTQISWGEEPDFFGPHYRFRQDLIIGEILKYFQKGKILDAGSGSGWVSLRLAKIGFRVWGIDISKGCVNYSSLKAREFGVYKRARFNLGDIKNINFPNEFFDVVICSEVIEHIKDDKKAVKELKRVLKRGGICVVTVPAHMKYWGIEDEWGGHFRRYTRETLSELFNDWKIEKVSYFGFPIGNFYYRFIYRPLFKKKILFMGNNKNIKKKLFFLFIKNIKKLFGNEAFARLSALPFMVDRLFISNKKGFALILVARKE